MREHHRKFTHEQLRLAVFADPEQAKRQLGGKGADKWLRQLWDEAGAATGSDEEPSLLRAAAYGIHGYDSWLVSFPPPEHAGEASGVMIAFPKDGGEAVYFLLEKSEDDTGTWVRYKADGERIDGEYVVGTEPKLLGFAFKVAMKVPAEWELAQQREAEERAKRPRRTVPENFKIPGWYDEDLLARILVSYRSVTLYVLLVIGCLCGAAFLGGLGILAAAEPAQACMEANDKGYSAYKYCLRREKKESFRYVKKSARKLCKKEAKGKPLLQYCAERDGDELKLLGLGAAGVGGAFFFALLGWLHRRRPPKFVRVLRDAPRDVVWIYVYTVRRRGGGTVFEQVYLGLKDGTRCTIDIVGSRDQVLRNVVACASYATMGYTEENKRRFKKDPASMRRM